MFMFFFFQAEDGIRDVAVTGVQTCALPISAERCPDARATNPTPQASCSRQGSSSRERLWAQRDRSATGIVSPVHDRSTERPALLGAGRGVCLESATRLRPPPAPIGGRSEERRVGKERRSRW